jgi:hypothetical protein
MRALPMLLLAAGLALPAAAPAGVVKPWIGIDGSWAGYSMTDMNRELVGEIDAAVRPYGYRLHKIEDGFGFSAAFGVSLPVGIELGIGYERLSATTDLLTVWTLLTINAPANAFRAFAAYEFPIQGPMGLHLGVAAGIISEAGEIGEDWVSIKTTGTGPLLEGSLGSDFWATPQFGLAASLGYRYAKVGKVKSEVLGVSETMRNRDGSNFTTDYSGVFVRLGFKVALTK